MEWFTLIDVVIHVDKYISLLLQQFGIWSYLVLFFIIFCETGLVITPLLPGDSLLFVLGAFAARDALNIFVLFFILTSAAGLGDSVNYGVGNYFGEKVLTRAKWFKEEYLDKTKDFYSRYGSKTVVIARFVPIVRTFAPFVAGVGKMKYSTFLFYNVVGGVTWIGSMLFAGYFFGQILFIQENLTVIILSIIVISFIPV